MFNKQRVVTEKGVCPPLPPLLPGKTKAKAGKKKKRGLGCSPHPAVLSSVLCSLVIQLLLLCRASIYRWDFNLTVVSDSMETLQWFWVLFRNEGDGWLQTLRLHFHHSLLDSFLAGFLILS